MIAGQNFYDTCFTIFHPTASATVYGQRPKFFRAKHSATAEGENWAYGPTLSEFMIPAFHDYILFGTKNHEMRGPPVPIITFWAKGFVSTSLKFSIMQTLNILYGILGGIAAFALTGAIYSYCSVNITIIG